MSNQSKNKNLYDLLVTKNFDIQALDSRTGRAPVDDQGNPDIAQADEFRFDYTPESGRNYGSVVILLGNDNDLTMFFGDNVGRGMETEDKNEWFDFLEQMKNFATKNFMTFTPENITKLKYTKQGQAAIKEGLFESWQGRGDTSWNGQPTEARIVIKHKKKLGESDARFRYIESIYVETAEGERFKLKSRSLTAGKAMLEHVRQGGNPYDARGIHINEIVEELSVLSRFRRANAGKVFEGETKNLVEQTNVYYENMHSVLKHLGTHRGYQSYFESWSPADVDAGDVIIEDLKNLFVKQSIDHRIEEALPILARITQESNTMKELEIFESWVNNMTEGTWALPETAESRQKLIDLLSADFPVGPDATNATEQLYDILGDDELFDQLHELADADADADARSIVLARMQELSDHPDIQSVLDQIQTTDTASPEATNPTDIAPDQGVAEGEVYDLGREYGAPPPEKKKRSQDPDDHNPYPFSPEEDEDYFREIFRKKREASKATKQGMAEGDNLATFEAINAMRRAAGLPITEATMIDESGNTWDHLLDRFKHEVQSFRDGGELDSDLYDALFDYYSQHGAMPYGVAKARTGDPYNWVSDHLARDLGLDENLIAPVAMPVTTEGGACNMTAEGQYCPEHGLAECGIYEYTGNITNFGLEESDHLSQLRRLAFGK